MSLIMKNEIPYGKRNHSMAYCAGKAIADANGDEIATTYAKKADVEEAIGGNASIVDNAAGHNSILRLKNITEMYTSGEFFDRIADGTFEDIFIGDYFTASYAGTSKTFRIAGLDFYMGTGDAGHEVTVHHAVIVPDEGFGNSNMNGSNTTANGYYGSNMRTSTIASVNTNLTTLFGEHLMTIREKLSNAMDSSVRSAGLANTGAASGAAWYDSKAELMSEIEVYGGPAFGSSMYDIGVAKTQFPLFKLGPQFINPGRFDWWLRSVASSAIFAHVRRHGYAGYDNASYSLVVRPRFVLY